MSLNICKGIIICLISFVYINAEARGTKAAGCFVSDSLQTLLFKDTVLTDRENFKISYHLNRYELDSTYMANRENLSRLRRTLSESDRIDSIVIYSFASPEGPLDNNLRLALNRGTTAKNHIIKVADEYGLPIDNDNIRLRTRGENWDDLKTIVLESYRGSDRDRLLQILDSDMPLARKKTEIRRLGKNTWDFVIDNFMPHLRSAEVVCVYGHRVRTLRMRHDEVPVIKGFEPVFENSMAADSFMQMPLPAYGWRTRAAVKTNMLYDALAWVNYSIEVPFTLWKKRFSVTFDHQFPWWRWGEGRNKYCNRYLQIGGEARWWFAPQRKPRTRKKILRDCLSGHFVTLYGMTGKYDFEWARKFCYQGEFWSAGMTYGYSMPVSRLFNMEFAVSLGYASITYRHYTPSDDYDILIRDPEKMGRLNHFGVTKLAVSLVMPIKFRHHVRTGKENVL